MSGLWSEQVAAAVARHMNDDHAEDCLLLVQTLGGRPAATAARMTGMTPAGLVLEAEERCGVREVVVPWVEVPVVRADVRVQVVRLHERARAAAADRPRS